jgi:hypothetical protein
MAVIRTHGICLEGSRFPGVVPILDGEIPLRASSYLFRSSLEEARPDGRQNPIFENTVERGSILGIGQQNGRALSKELQQRCAEDDEG